MTQLSRKAKLALGGTVGGLAAAGTVLFFAIRSKKNSESLPGRTNTPQDVASDLDTPIDYDAALGKYSQAVQKNFAGDAKAQDWAKSKDRWVISSPEFDKFFSQSYTAGKKKALAAVLRATFRMHRAQAVKLESEGELEGSEVHIVNAAISKSLSQTILNSTSLSAEDVPGVSEPYADLLSKLNSMRGTLGNKLYFRCENNVYGELIAFAQSHFKALRRECVHVIKSRKGHEVFLRLVETMEMKEGTGNLNL